MIAGFIPDVKKPVIGFADYVYTPQATPIWNLPGYYMRRDELEERRQWLAEHLGEDPSYPKEKAKLDAAVRWWK